MVIVKTLKKFTPHLIIMATLIAIAVPTLGSYALNELSPYLALSEELAKPEAIVADHIEIVDRTYVDDDPSKGWETVTWAFKLEVTNRGDEDIILPAANLTLHYLDGTLGKGWISHRYEIAAGKSKMVNLYIVMENDIITKTWFSALLRGEHLDLTAIFEPYILIDGPTSEPFLPLSMVQELEFSFPHQSRGPAPFIHSITRSAVRANQPVSVSVSATDKGTGISNRTYIYYSINNGITWNQIVMTGGVWWNRYKYHIDEYGAPHGLLEGCYPIRSTLQEETYEGEIPGFSSGTSVLFKVYLEDYAGNYEHKKKANWVESQTYSYIVPGAGALPEFTQKFKQITEPSSTDKFFDYLELNGINLMNYLYLNGVNSWILSQTTILAEISDFFYLNDIDASYCMGMVSIESRKGYDIMSDSGISAGYLLELFGISFDDLLDYLVEHIFLPTKHDLAQQARYILDEIVIIDDIEQYYKYPITKIYDSPWFSNDSRDILKIELFGMPRKISNIGEDRVGTYRLKWTTTGKEIIGRSFDSPRDLSKCDYLTFMLDYDNHTRLNGKLSVFLTDNNGLTMTSNQITFEKDGGGLSEIRPDQQITLGLNSRDFIIDPGFNFGAIHQMNFTYNGILPLNIWLDHISAYSSRAYNRHQYFTFDLKLTNLEIEEFIHGFIYLPDNGKAIIQPAIFWGIDANMGALLVNRDDIITDWSAKEPMNKRRTGFWNFLNLIATDNGKLTAEIDKLGELGKLNNHMTAANLMLENRTLNKIPITGTEYYYTLGERSAINFYELLVSLVDTEIEESDDDYVKREDIYPYTQNVAMMMIYIPLGAVAALAIVLRVREHRYKTKIKKIRDKYIKIRKR